MLSLILNFKSYLKEIAYAIVAIIFAVMVGFIVYYHHHVQTLDTKIDSYTKEIATLSVTIQYMDQTIDNQNISIKLAQTKADDYQKQLNDTQNTINNINTKYDKQIADITKQKTPVSCEDAVDFFQKNLGNIKW